MHTEFRQLAQAYEEAALALSYNRFNTVSRISWYSGFAEREFHPLSFREGDIRNLEQQLKYGSDEVLFALFDTLKAQALEDASGMGSLDLYMLTLVAHISRHLSESASETLQAGMLSNI